MSTRRALDPVTFEVLKNALGTSVDLMSEQILRTCQSFVIYARDFSCSLCDAEGNTVMQGSQDIAVHVGTLHFTCKAVIAAFGDDIHEGDIILHNDPYGGATRDSLAPEGYEEVDGDEGSTDAWELTGRGTERY